MKAITPPFHYAIVLDYESATVAMLRDMITPHYADIT